MGALTGNTISSSYLGLLKTSDNAILNSTLRLIEDGGGTDASIKLSTTQLGLADGTTTVPSLTFSSNSDTGFYYSSDVTYYTLNGTTQLAIGSASLTLNNDSKLQWNNSDVYIQGTTSSDNIQIGVGGSTQFTFAQTTGLRLHQYGSGSITGTVTQRLGVTSSGQVVEIPIGGGAVDGSGTAGKITKWTDSDTIGDSIITESSSKIGIDIATPQNKLHVHQSDADSHSYIHITQEDGGSASTDGMSIGVLDGGVNASVRLRENGYLNFWTNNQERIRLDSSGNLGINETNPTSRLEIAGGSLASGTVTNIGIASALTTGRTRTYDSSSLGSISTRGDSSAIEIAAGSSAGYFSGIGITSRGATAASGTIIGYTYGAERFRVDASGDFGIGLTNPLHPLHVNGNTLIEGTLSVYGNSTIGDNFADAHTINGSTTIRSTNTSTVAVLDVTRGDANNEGANATDFRFVASNRLLTSERANMEIYTNDAQDADLGASIGFGGRHTDASTNDSLFATIKSGKTNNTSAEFGGYLTIGTAKSDSDIVERFRITQTGELKLTNSDGIRLSAQVSNLYATSGTLSYYGTDNAVYLNGAGANGWLRLNAAGGENGRNTIDIFGSSASSPDTINFRTVAGDRARFNSNGVLTVGSTTVQTQARLNVRENGSGIEFGHTNTSDFYFGTLGSLGSNGSPFISWSCMNEHNVNTFTTKGAKGNLIRSNTAGELLFQQVTATNTTGQTPVTRVELNSSGRLTFNTYGSGTHTGTATKFLAVDTNGRVIEEATSTIDGSGTAGRVVKWSDSDTITDSGISDSSNALAITINGNEEVGIGVSPLSVLHIGKPSGNTNLRIESGTASSVTGTSTITMISRNASSGTSPSSKIESIFEDSHDSALAFHTSDAGSETEKLRIDSTGRVLIGQNSNTGSANASNIVVGTGTGNEGISIFSGADSGGSLHFMDAGANDDGFISYNHPNQFMQFGTQASEKMRLTSSGQLGLGVIPRTDTHATWSQFFLGEKGSLISEKLNSGGIYGMYITDNLYIDSDTGNFGLITADEASAYRQEAGQHQFYTVASGSAGGAAGLVEQIRFDTNGVIELVESSSSGFLNANGTSLELDVNRNPETGAFGDTNKSHARLNLTGSDGGSHIHFNTANSNNTTATERGRFDSAGRFFLGHTSAILSSSEKFSVSAGTNGINVFSNSATGNGTLYLQNTNNSTSDWQTYLIFQDGVGNRCQFGNYFNTSTLGISGHGGIELKTGATSLASATTRMSITSGGDVGIGVTPSAKFHVKQTAANYIGHFETTHANSYGVWIEEATGASAGYPLLQITPEGGSNPYLRVDSGGKVGIGTSSPSVLLDVRGEVAVAYNADYGLRFYNQDRNNWASIGNDVPTGDSTADLVFKDSTGEAMRLVGGNLGVGTSTPNPFSWGQKHLTVSSGGTNHYAALDLVGSGTGGGFVNFGGGDGSGTANNILRGNLGFEDGSKFVINTNGSNSGSSLTNRFILDKNGRTGINATPNSYTTGLVVGRWAGYDGTGVDCPLVSGHTANVGGMFLAQEYDSSNGDFLGNFSSNHSSAACNWGWGVRGSRNGEASASSTGWVSTVDNASFARSAIRQTGSAISFWFASTSSTAIGTEVSMTKTINATALGNFAITGQLSKGSGSFKIDHPLEDKKDTHHLVHSFIEGPQADLIYRGKIDLENGKAIINIDTEAGMTEGTFVLLNTNVQCFTSNESDWDAVKGKVEGNILTIECKNNKSTATVSWMVVGERQDQHMKDTNWTDENGKVIVEPEKTDDEDE